EPFLPPCRRDACFDRVQPWYILSPWWRVSEIGREALAQRHLRHQSSNAKSALLMVRGLTRAGLAAGGHLRPGVAQADGAIKHRPLRRRVRVGAEIALALELHGGAGMRGRQGRLDARAGDHLERARIHLGGEIADL